MHCRTIGFLANVLCATPVRGDTQARDTQARARDTQARDTQARDTQARDTQARALVYVCVVDVFEGVFENKY